METVGLIFAAGLGTRLKPFTDSHPKALAPVTKGLTAFDIALKNITRAGINTVAVNIHHFPEQMRSHIAECEKYGAAIVISDESALLLDTGGGLLKASRLLPEDSAILIQNADIVTDVDLAEMKREFENSSADVMILASERDTSRYLLFDTENRLHGWKNIKTGQVKPPVIEDDLEDLHKLAFGGIHLLSPKALKRLNVYHKTIVGSCEDEITPFPIMDFYIWNCSLPKVEQLDIRAWHPKKSYRWHDIGTPERLMAVQSEYKGLQL